MRWMVDRTLAKRAATNPDEIDPDTGLPSPQRHSGARLRIRDQLRLALRLRPYRRRRHRRPHGSWRQALRSRHRKTIPRFSDHNPFYHDWVSVIMFALLAFSLYYFARKPMEKS